MISEIRTLLAQREKVNPDYFYNKIWFWLIGDSPATPVREMGFRGHRNPRPLCEVVRTKRIGRCWRHIMMLYVAGDAHMNSVTLRPLKGDRD
jgi:hypothetical protein